MKLLKKAQHFLASEEGPTTVEYAIMLALIVLACIGVIGALGQHSNATFERARDELESYNMGS